MARVRVSARAEDSLERHDDWLRARDPRAADRFLGEVERLAALLAEHPFAGARVEGRPLRFVVTRRSRYRMV